MTPGAILPEPSCWLEHRVSYGETDAMGVVYYANYLHFFERGRSELIRNLGLGYSAVEEQGIFLPVREASCRYLAPARYDEVIHIHTTLSGRTRASLSFVYEITRPDRRTVLTRGFTQHAVVNAQGRPVRIPDWFAARLLEQEGRPPPDGIALTPDGIAHISLRSPDASSGSMEISFDARPSQRSFREATAAPPQGKGPVPARRGHPSLPQRLPPVRRDR